MPRTCTCCQHKDRAAINRALVDGFESQRRIAQTFGVTESSLYRHNRDHLPAVLRQGATAARLDEATALEVRRAAEPVDLLARVRKLFDEANVILSEAKQAGDPRVALLALDRLLKSLALEGMTLQAAAERGAGEPKTIRIEWGWTCPSCGLHRLDGTPPPKSPSRARRRAERGCGA